MKKALISFLILLIPVLGSAQIEFDTRYEQEHDAQTLDYMVIPNEVQGLLVLQREFDSAQDYPIIVKHLNNELEVQWEETLTIPQFFFVKGHRYTEEKTYLILQNQTRDVVKILRLDTEQKKIDQFETRDLLELDITHLEVLKNTVVMGGYFEDRPAVFAYDFEQKFMHTLQNVYQNRSELLDIKVNKDMVTFNVLASVWDDKRDRTVVVNTYDFAGNAVRDYELEVRPDYKLINAVSSSINDKAQVVVGLYGVKSRKMAAGIYINKIDRSGKQSMTYHNLGTLPNFFDYMGRRKAAKQRSKALSLQQAGKEQRYRTEMILRNIIEQDGKLIVTGEFHKNAEIRLDDDRFMRRFDRPQRFDRFNRQNLFDPLHPLFQANPQSGLNVKWNTSTPEGTFLRLQQETHFTHAYALVIDQEGQLEWGDYMTVDETKVGWAGDMASFQWLGDDKGAYLYYHQRTLRAKLMDGSGAQEVLETPLSLKASSDELRHERGYTTGTDRWYGNNFVVYGVQHVRPKDKSEAVRTVFFINKLSAKADAKISEVRAD